MSVESREAVYVKLIAAGWPVSAADESERLRWLSPFVPVPEVIEEGFDGSVAWLVSRPLPGRTAIDSSLGMEPAAIALALGRGLRRFHEALPIANCPFIRTNESELRALATRVAAAEIESMLAIQPEEEDLVVTHGDACLPNFLLEFGEVTGYLDVGDLGVADRWRDLAVVIWSLQRNLGPGLEDRLLGAYGAPRDEKRLSFYQALYFAQ